MSKLLGDKEKPMVWCTETSNRASTVITPLDALRCQPTVTSVQRVTSSTSFTLNCTSIGSPASVVMWSKDGTLLHITDSYQTTQIMVDGSSATYYNLLTVNSEPQDLLGTYGCSVLNTIGVSNVETISIEGMRTLELD